MTSGHLDDRFIDGDPDAPPSAEEAREAEALARALDAGASEAAGAPAGVMESAALLRDAGARVPLPSERAADVEARLAPSLDARRAAAAMRARARRRTTWTLVGASVVGLALWMATWHLDSAPRAPASVTAAAVPPPPPPAELLGAQAQGARGGPQALAALDREMRGYRRRSPWLASAAAHHARADALLDGGDPAGARAELRAVLDGYAARAAGGALAGDGGEGRPVLQDTRYRLARLDLDARDARAALAEAESGLALGRPPDLFVVNLLLARGAAHEALGDPAAAAEDYHQALVINDQLLQREAGQP